MRSKNFVIPACLVTTKSEFTKHIEFARKVGNSLHVDIVDPNFVEGNSLPIEDWPLIDIEYCEAHLMVSDPLQYLSKAKAKGVTRGIIHVESAFDLDELVTEARVNDILLGFAVSPETDLTTLRRFFSVSPYIQVMGIHPGRTGQTQLPNTSLAVSYLNKLPYRLTITVDGGVNLENISELKQAGADFVVATTAIYEEGDWKENYSALLKKASE
jgi:ribulose-phosphate 3-epimerase